MTPMAAARVFAKRRAMYRGQRKAEFAERDYEQGYAFSERMDAVTALWNDLKEASEESE